MHLIYYDFLHRETDKPALGIVISLCNSFDYAMTMFLSLFYYCLSVCLSATLRKNAWTDFDGIFSIDQTWHKKQSGRFGGISIQPLGYRIVFPIFFGDSESVSNIKENGWMDFVTFFDRSDVTQKTICHTSFGYFVWLLCTGIVLFHVSWIHVC